jgi:transcriptional regulator GlxA family with amidase domain
VYEDHGADVSLNVARRLVVTHRCGFGSAARMRAAFLRHPGVGALAYRQHFGAFRQPGNS